MKKILIMLFLVAGCTKEAAKKDVNVVACALETTMTSLVSSAVGNTLACKNLDAVKADIKVQVEKLNICKEPTPTPAPAAPATAMSLSATTTTAKSNVGAIFCGPIVEGLMTSALTQIPQAWECTGGVPADKIKAVVLEACLKSL